MRAQLRWMVIIAVFLLAGPVQAQSPNQPAIDKFIISVWPEYDHPGVLVIFNGRFDESAIPVQVKFPVPERSRFALVAGSTDTTANSMIPIPIQDGESGKEISFTVVQPSFHVEFYFNPFPSEGAERHYQYDFTSNRPIDSLIVDLQEPLAAENFNPEVPVDHRMEDSHGIVYHRRHINSLPAGDSVHIEARYQNPTGQMTNRMMQDQMGQAQAQAGGTMPPGAQQSGPDNRIWVLAVVGLALIGVLFYVTRSGSEEHNGVAEAPGDTTSTEEPVSSSDSGTHSGEKKYCIHCGSQLSIDAKFCTRCGEPQEE